MNYIVNAEDALLRDKPSRFFHHVFNSLHPISTNITLRPFGDAPVNSSQDIYDIFLVEFARNFSALTNATRKNKFCPYGSGTEVLQNFNIDITTVYQCLKERTCSAAGQDEIPGIIKKMLPGSLAVSLSIAYLQSVNQCAIPNTWRHAFILPLYKGDKDLPASNRPISLIDVAGNIFERIIARQLQEFFTCSGLLSVRKMVL